MTTKIVERDTDAERELDLYAENTYELYGQFQAIIANLQRKIARRRYSPSLAPKLWRYWYDEAAQRYCREFGGTVARTFPARVRQACADQRAADEFEKITNGEYDPRPVD